MLRGGELNAFICGFTLSLAFINFTMGHLGMGLCGAAIAAINGAAWWHYSRRAPKL